MEQQWVIYTLQFPSGKFYVGQTCDFKRRMNQYKRINQYKNYYRPLCNAIHKYGWNKVRMKVEQICSLENVDEWERFYIIAYNSLVPNGYNCESGGNKNKTQSIQTRRKISETKRGKNNNFYGKKHSVEAREKMSKAAKGRKLSEKTKRKMSEAQKDRKFSKEHRRKLSEAAKAQWVKRKQQSGIKREDLCLA